MSLKRRFRVWQIALASLAPILLILWNVQRHRPHTPFQVGIDLAHCLAIQDEDCVYGLLRPNEIRLQGMREDQVRAVIRQFIFPHVRPYTPFFNQAHIEGGGNKTWATIPVMREGYRLYWLVPVEELSPGQYTTSLTELCLSVRMIEHSYAHLTGNASNLDAMDLAQKAELRSLGMKGYEDTEHGTFVEFPK